MPGFPGASKSREKPPPPVKHKQQHLTQHTAEPVCHGSDQISVNEFAKELLQPVRDFMQEHNLQTIYLVTPSPMLTKKETNLSETMSDTVTEIFKDAFSDLSVFTRVDLRAFAASNSGFEEMLVDDTYRTSLTEQEMCFKSEWFLGDVVSSWSQTVLADRRARQIERDNELEDLLTLPNALVGKMVPIGESEHLELPPEPPQGYAAVPGSEQHPMIPGFSYKADPNAPAAASQQALPPGVVAPYDQAAANAAAVSVQPGAPQVPSQPVPAQPAIPSPVQTGPIGQAGAIAGVAMPGQEVNPVSNPLGPQNSLVQAAVNAAISPVVAAAPSNNLYPDAPVAGASVENLQPVPQNNLPQSQPVAAVPGAPVAPVAAAAPVAPAVAAPIAPIAPAPVAPAPVVASALAAPAIPPAAAPIAAAPIPQSSSLIQPAAAPVPQNLPPVPQNSNPAVPVPNPASMVPVGVPQPVS